MTTIHKEIVISASPEGIFEILDDPEAVLRYGPGVTRVSDVQRSEGRIGDSTRLTYSVMGLRFPMKFTTLEYSKPSKILARMEGGMRGTFGWNLKPEGSTTRVALDIDYQMRGGILGKVMDRVLVERMNEKNAERMLENLALLAQYK